MIFSNKKKIDKLIEIIAVQDARLSEVYEILKTNHGILSQFHDRLNTLEDRKTYSELIGETFPGESSKNNT